MPELFQFCSQLFPPPLSNGIVEAPGMSRNRALLIYVLLFSHFNDHLLSKVSIKAVGNPNIKDTVSAFKLIKI